MTTLIKNILLIDGTLRPPAKADVLLKGEKIIAIGYFPNYKADEIIDGMGAYLAPGFIDINTTSDLYLSLFSDPSQSDFIKQGITTIIGGQNGISLAPLFDGSLGLNKFWTNTSKININWDTAREFLDSLKKRFFGVNFGTLVGHSTLRNFIVQDDFRDLTQKEIDVLKYITEQSLRDGVFGLSMDLSFPLTSLAPYKEIKSLAESVEKNKGLLSVKIRSGADSAVFYKTFRNNFLASIEEIINLAKETAVRTEINNFQCLKGYEKEYEKSIKLIDENSASADVHFNLHPFDVSIIPLFGFLPMWAQRGSFGEIKSYFNSPETIAKIKKDLPIIKGKEVEIFQAPGNEYLVNKTLDEFCRDRGVSAKEGLLELMKQTNLRGTLIFKNLSTKPVLTALASGRAIISSSAASFHEDADTIDMKQIKAFSRILEMASREKKLPVEMVIQKFTGLPARQLGLKDRGIIAENYFADLVLIRDSKIEIVIVNGKIAMRDGEIVNSSNGKILRHKF